MVPVVASGDPPLPEPPDPPDLPILPSSSIQTSIAGPSLFSPAFPPSSSPDPDLYLKSVASSYVSLSDTPFACLRFLTAMCSFQFKICEQICLLPVNVVAKSVGHDVSPILLSSTGSGLLSPVSLPLFLVRVACFYSDTSTSPPTPTSQVYSFSPSSDSSTMGSHQIFVEFMVLVFRNVGLEISFTMVLVTFGSTFVLSCGTHIAFVRPFTAVCRSCSDIAMSMVALMAFSILWWQLGQRTHFICTLLVNLVHLGFHSPVFSLMELIFLPNTSLVFSGIITGSFVSKAVLLGAEARMSFISRLAIFVADCLTLMEALFPPLCGFAQDYQAKEVLFFWCSCLDATLIELMSSPLSLSLFLSIVVDFSFTSCSTSVLVVDLDCSAPCGHVVSSLSGG